MILGSALWPCCVTLRPMMSQRTAPNRPSRASLMRQGTCAPHAKSRSCDPKRGHRGVMAPAVVTAARLSPPRGAPGQ
jgi:hypothetical protein